jgi:hypothetical protein
MPMTSLCPTPPMSGRRGTRTNPVGPTLSTMLSLVEVTSEVVLPAIRAVFEEGEISAFEISRTDELEGSVRLSLTVRGETFLDYVIQGHVDNMSPEDWCERLRSNLVDFVAESRFGWGQNRNVR